MICYSLIRQTVRKSFFLISCQYRALLNIVLIVLIVKIQRGKKLITSLSDWNTHLMLHVNIMIVCYSLEESPLKRGWITSVSTHILGERVMIISQQCEISLLTPFFPYFYLFCHKDISSYPMRAQCLWRTRLKSKYTPSLLISWCFQIHKEHKLVLDMSVVLVK